MLVLPLSPVLRPPRARGMRVHAARWVSPEVCQMYNIAGSAAEAWEANGGGKFSRM
jgi:hypothetical protein